MMDEKLKKLKEKIKDVDGVDEKKLKESIEKRLKTKTVTK